MDQDLRNRLKQKLFFLKGVEDNIAEEFLDELNNAENFSKGDIICAPNMKSRGLGILISGKLEIEAGNNLVSIKQMEAPDVFGAASLFGGHGYVSTMRAVNSVSIIFVSQEQLSSLMTRSFRVTQNYINFLSEKVRFLNCRIENFTAGCSAATLKDHLLQNADEDGVLVPPKNMSQLAKMLNMGRTSLYRAVEELEGSGQLVRYKNKWVIINNLKGEI